MLHLRSASTERCGQPGTEGRKLVLGACRQEGEAGLHCAQWGKLLPQASVLAANPFTYLHLKLSLTVSKAHFKHSCFPIFENQS